MYCYHMRYRVDCRAHYVTRSVRASNKLNAIRQLNHDRRVRGITSKIVQIISIERQD